MNRQIKLDDDRRILRLLLNLKKKPKNLNNSGKMQDRLSVEHPEEREYYQIKDRFLYKAKISHAYVAHLMKKYKVGRIRP
jgi:hypothetical protein